VWRRSGGSTPRLEAPELTVLYAARLAGVGSMAEFLARPLDLDLGGLVPPEARARFMSLPNGVIVREQAVALGYDVEVDEAGTPYGVVWLHLPEKLARTLVEEELPPFDRPVRFRVSRGRRGLVRGDTLLDLQDQLDLPWTSDELEQAGEGGHGRMQGRAHRRPGRR
jgi:ATP-dependent helicase HrpA